MTEKEPRSGFWATEFAWDGLGIALIILAIVFGLSECQRCSERQERWELERKSK